MSIPASEAPGWSGPALALLEATVRRHGLHLGRRATPLVALHAELALSSERGPASSPPAGQNS